MESNTDKKIDFSYIYTTYFAKLTRFASTYVIYEEEAENIVQDIFIFLWERKDSLDLIVNINAYMFRLVRNKCLDYLRKQTTAEKYNQYTQDTYQMELSLKLQSLDKFDEELFSDNDIEEKIQNAINSLPERCREIFVLSKFENLKYKEIADKLGVSVNTVENQMSIALKRLRISLKDCMILFLFIIS